MVCIPCIVVPVLLYIWHKFLQPILLRFWNPFGRVEEKKDAKDNTSKQDDNPEKTGEEKLVSNGYTKLSCPFSSDTPKVLIPDGHPVHEADVTSKKDN